MIAYVDSSAVVRRIVDDTDSDVALDLWMRADEVVASERVRDETRAVLDAMLRSGRLDTPKHRAALRMAEVICDDLRLVETEEAIVDSAAELAAKHGLSGIDAIHLAAALSVDAPRIVVTTWRAPLAMAASECGMPVVPRPPVRAAA